MQKWEYKIVDSNETLTKRDQQEKILRRNHLSRIK